MGKNKQTLPLIACDIVTGTQETMRPEGKNETSIVAPFKKVPLEKGEKQHKGRRFRVHNMLS